MAQKAIHHRRTWVRWVSMEGSSIWLMGGPSGPEGIRTHALHAEGATGDLFAPEVLQLTERVSSSHPAFQPVMEKAAPMGQRDRLRAKFGRMTGTTVSAPQTATAAQGRWVPSLKPSV